MIQAASELMPPPIQSVTHLNLPMHRLLCGTSYVSDTQTIPYIVLKKKMNGTTVSENSKEARGRR
jgi:hypothetical protein